MSKTKRNLHPSIMEFKEFVKQHPKLIEEVRSQQKTWKELYEDWYLFGAEDEMWNQYRSEAAGDGTDVKETKEEEEKKDFISTLLTSLKNIDVNQMQHHISNVNSAISNIQQVLQQFQPSKSNNRSNQAGPNHPFGFRKD